MDIEQLKLVLETLQSVSHDAGDLAALWMWLKFGAYAAAHLFWGGIVLGCAYAVYRMVSSSNGGDETEIFLRDMRDRLGTGTSGPLSDRERCATIDAIRALVAEKRVKEKT